MFNFLFEFTLEHISRNACSGAWRWEFHFVTPKLRLNFD